MTHDPERQDDDDIPIVGPRRDLAVPDSETIDDLIDSLWRHGSAQDYPQPEPDGCSKLFVKRLNDHRHSHFRDEYTDRRSLTRDQKLDEPPVPGYKDFPSRIAANLNFGCLTMPSSSPKQARTMAAATHNPKFAKNLGIPQKVAKEFNRADAKSGIRKSKKS